MHDETIIILANAEWDWSTRVNCHHIAARLARENCVLFVDTIGGRTPAPREWGKIARRLRRIAGGIRRINSGLTVLSPFVVPVYGSDAIRRINSVLLTLQIRRALPNAQPPILWIFLPALVGLVGRFGEKLVVYHCVDTHAANPHVPARRVIEWEQRLLNVADVVFATASTLYRDKQAHNKNTYYVPNVGDAEHFVLARDGALAIAEDLAAIPRPIAGYVGNVSAYKMDFELLRAVAEQRSDWSFVLIGPIGRGDPSSDTSRLQSLKNVYLLGERPYSELPRYVKGFDVCLIPFNQNESTRGSLPMKFFEYLAAGKPVIATDLPTLAEFREYFYPIRDAAQFSRALDAAVHEDAERGRARVRLAQHYSWDARMVELEGIVAAALERRR